MRNYPFSAQLCRAFTLIEMMIAVAILAVITALAAPAFSSLIERNRTSTSATQLMNALILSRAEAIKRNRATRLCQSSDGVTCTAGSWQDGWLLWIDSEGDGSHEAADVEEVIRVFPALPEGVELTNSRNMTWVGYRVDGSVVGSTGIANATWSICFVGGSGDFGRKIIVSRTGRPRRELGADCSS